MAKRSFVKDIELDVNGKTFSFQVGPAEYNGYVNELTQADKIAPSHSFLLRSICAEQKQEFKELIAEPGYSVPLAGALFEEYSPNVEVSVKKPSE